MVEAPENALEGIWVTPLFITIVVRLGIVLYENLGMFPLNDIVSSDEQPLNQVL
jgi:hypothetical protein